VLLSGSIGKEFDAGVLDVDQPRDPSPQDSPTVRGVIAIDEPPVRGRCEGDLRLGERVRVRLTRADPDRRVVLFAVVPPPAATP
jgi:hypothetical protein